MKKKMIQIEVQIYQELTELSDSEQRLLHRAYEALQTAYAPYSGFQVGAAALLANGEVTEGSNQENAAYPMCLCAERAALAEASSRHPGVAVRSLAIVCRHIERPILQPGAPCGACRQVISEIEDRYGEPVALLMRGTEGPVYKMKSGKDLLPLAFSGAFL